MPEYNVLLSYPDYSQPNQVSVLNGNGAWTLLSKGIGKAIGPPEALKQQSDPKANVWWNAYAKSGSASSTLVYANFGMLSDYQQLEDGYKYQ